MHVDQSGLNPGAWAAWQSRQQLKLIRKSNPIDINNEENRQLELLGAITDK